MKKINKKIILLALLSTVSFMGKSDIVINNPADTEIIFWNTKTSDNMIVTGNGPGTNEDLVSANYLHGYDISWGATLENTHKINLNGQNNIGIIILSELLPSTFHNSKIPGSDGEINLNGINNIGILLNSGLGSVVNDSTINLNQSSSGIAIAGSSKNNNFTGSIVNSGIINLFGHGTAIFISDSQSEIGGSVMNYGTINTGDIPTNIGAHINGPTSFGNTGTISGKNNTLIRAGNGAVIHNANNGNMAVKENGAGVILESFDANKQTTLRNDGNIESEDGTAVYSSGSVVENQGNISSRRTAVVIDEYRGIPSSFINYNNGNILVNGGIGILIIGSTAENLGQISISGNQTQGIVIFGGESHEGKFINKSPILSDSDKSDVTLISLMGNQNLGEKRAYLENYSDLTVLGNHSTALLVTGNSKINNTGKITVKDGIGLNLREGASLALGDNKGDIIVNGNGVGISSSFSSSNSSSVVTDSDIYLEGSGTGILIQTLPDSQYSITGEYSGSLSLDGNSSNGFYISGPKSSFKNTGIIKLSSGNYNTGVLITNNAAFENTGDIVLDNSNSSLGINLTDGGTLTANTGTINLSGNSIGIAGDNSTIYSSGTIIGADSLYGIFGYTSYVENSGSITMERGAALALLYGSTLINSGSLNITTEGIGIRALNSNITNNSTGTIDVASGTNIYAVDSKIENHAILTNSNGTAIHSDNSIIENYSTINTILGSAIWGENSSIIENSGTLNITTEGTGIHALNSDITNNSTGTIDVASGMNIYAVNSKIKNHAILTNSKGTAIHSENSIIENSGTLNITTEGTGIHALNSDITNNSTGTIDVASGTNIYAVNSKIKNHAILTNSKGTAIYSDNSAIENYSTVNAILGPAILGENNSIIENSGTLNSSTIGIISSVSEVLNTGIINSDEIGIQLLNNKKSINSGEIHSKTGVSINSGTEKYSGHFYNDGTISGTDYSIKFDDGDSVLELGNGSKITGNIDGSLGENILIANGNIDLETVNNFNKLVSAGNSVINGTINLNPTENPSFYTGAFTATEDISNITNDTALGNLTVRGVINIGVNYDGISGETSNTGKILAGTLILEDGSIILSNGGNTSNDLITESELSGSRDQIKIKNIVISNKQQAVNPDFRFQAAGGMEAKDGWTRKTVGRLVNGVTVLDEIYTKDSLPPDPDPDPVTVLNSVPRNRVDLDNINTLDSLSKRYLRTDSSDMNIGETRQSIEYTGTKAGSDFTAENPYNYNYSVDSDGITAVTLNKLNENTYAGFSLGYLKNDIKYSNNDKEDINSYNINIFGRRNAGNWNFDIHTAYGYNEHEINADWLGAGQKTSNYNSHVLKTGISLGYEQKLGNSGVSFSPGIGADYIYIYESKITTPGLSNIDAASGNGFTGSIKMNLGDYEGKVKWNAGIGYEQNFTDTFHEERKMSNNYIMEKLSYGKGTFTANLDLDFKLTDALTLKTGYKYENNNNYENHIFRTGISYVFDEAKY